MIDRINGGNAFMEIKIGKNTYNLEWCSQIAFKGNTEDCNLLCEKLGKENVKIENKNENLIIRARGFEVEKVLKIIKDFSNLKACAFIDEFGIYKNRKTYVVYSEAGEKNFTQIKFVGECDGQDDLPFSEEADLLQDKTKKYSYTLSLTGLRRSISYHFPFALEWEDKDTNMFRLDGDVLKEYIGTNDNVIIPNGVTKIEDKAFENKIILKEVYVPKSVKVIGDFAFSGCVNLEHVTIEKGVNFIGKQAFACCESLEEIIIPDSVSKTVMQVNTVWRTFSTGVFEKCTKLKNVTLSKKMRLMVVKA